MDKGMGQVTCTLGRWLGCWLAAFISAESQPNGTEDSVEGIPSEEALVTTVSASKLQMSGREARDRERRDVSQSLSPRVSDCDEVTLRQDRLTE